MKMGAVELCVGGVSLLSGNLLLEMVKDLSNKCLAVRGRGRCLGGAANGAAALGDAGGDGPSKMPSSCLMEASIPKYWHLFGALATCESKWGFINIPFCHQVTMGDFSHLEWWFLMVIPVSWTFCQPPNAALFVGYVSPMGQGMFRVRQADDLLPYCYQIMGLMLEQLVTVLPSHVAIAPAGGHLEDFLLKRPSVRCYVSGERVLSCERLPLGLAVALIISSFWLCPNILSKPALLLRRGEGALKHARTHTHTHVWRWPLNPYIFPA